MPSFLRFPWPYPPRGSLLAAFCAVYLATGLVGHDPWKSDDATHFGIAFAMSETGRWWVPQLAGETLVAAPPLFYWVALACMKLFGWILPLHDSARIASGLFGAAMLAGIGACARRLNGDDAGAPAVLLMLGCVGLPVHLHDAQPAIALLAAAAFALCGFARLPHEPIAGGMIAGVSIGVGFLARGWEAVLLLAPLLLVMPALAGPWRNRHVLAGGGLALLAACAVGAIWPLTLATMEPALWRDWADQVLYKPDSPALSAARLGGYLGMVSWYAWPALPLAIWILWKYRTNLTQPAVALPLATLLVFLFVLSGIATPRSATALPLLVPFVLLATPAATTLRRGAANAFDWFGMMTFSLLAGLIWIGWIAAMFGVPARVARNAAKLEPGFVMQFAPLAVSAAVAVTLAWIWLIFASPRDPTRGTVHWAAGMTTIWVLLATLWLPWIDYGRSYRQVAASLKAALPSNRSCIAGHELGTAQRASFHYFAGIKTVPTNKSGATKCQLMLIQGTGNPPNPTAEPGWRKIWEGRRPGDRFELYRLFKREQS